MTNREPWWAKYKVDVPEGVSGVWRVERFTVTEEDERAGRLRACNPSSRGRYTPAGEYTGLFYGKPSTFSTGVIMSDTPDEMRDHLGFIGAASGRVLISGLGLGMVTQAVLRNDKVTHCTVVEVSRDVIRLVGPTVRAIAAERPDVQFALVCGDAYTWNPSEAVQAHRVPSWVDEPYDIAWHDIWPDICEDNIQDFGRIRAHWRDWCLPERQHCWSEAMLVTQGNRQCQSCDWIGYEDELEYDEEEDELDLPMCPNCGSDEVVEIEEGTVIL